MYNDLDMQVELLRGGKEVKQIVQPREAKPGVYTIGVKLGPNTLKVNRVFPTGPVQVRLATRYVCCLSAVGT